MSLVMAINWFWLFSCINMSLISKFLTVKWHCFMTVSFVVDIGETPPHQCDDINVSDFCIELIELQSSLTKTPKGTDTGCSRHFSSSESLEKHLKHEHMAERLQISGNDSSAVATCNSTASCCVDEVSNDKPQAEQFVCTECGRQFRLRQLLATHSVTHTGARPAACRFPGCDKRFGQTSTRNYHERTHSDFRPYVCSQCGLSYKQPTILKTHIATVHGSDARPHQCSRCEKAFKLCGALKTHYKTVHMDDRPHVCVECQKRFKYHSQLLRHKRALHSRERPWICSVCDKTFTQSSNLQTHMRIHTGERPYSCSVCGQSFAHSGTLKGHMATHRCPSKHK